MRDLHWRALDALVAAGVGVLLGWHARGREVRRADERARIAEELAAGRGAYLVEQFGREHDGPNRTRTSPASRRPAAGPSKTPPDPKD